MSAAQIRSLLNSYIAANNLVNANDQAYINLDELLYSCVSAKSKGKAKGKDVEPESELSRFMKRDELTKSIIGKMQSWYAIRTEGKDPVTKSEIFIRLHLSFAHSRFNRRKGSLGPIQVVIKVRQGRKASTLISGFEPFLVVDAEEMAEDLRKACAGATSGKPRQIANPDINLMKNDLILQFHLYLENPPATGSKF